MKRLVIIDGKSVFYRGYYAMGGLSLPDGTPTGAVYGFAAMLIGIMSELKPDYVAVAWDKAKTNIRKRREIYPEYKANRKPAPEDFYTQIPYLMELLEAFHVPLYEYDDYEADDIMGSLSRKAEVAGVRVDLVSGDLDMLQIVDHDTDMYQMKKGFSDVEKFDVAAVEKKYGLKKEQFLDLKSLKGDSSDNIPGVPGIGEKGAIKLLQEYGTLDGVYEHAEEIKGSVGEKLRAGKDSAYMSRELSEIMFDAPVGFDPEATDVAKINKERVKEVLNRFQFRSLVWKFGKLDVGEGASNNGSDENTLGGAPVFTGHRPLRSAGSRGEARPSSTVSSEPLLEAPQTLAGSSGENHKIAEDPDLYLSWNVKNSMHEDEEVARKILAGEKFWDLGQVAFLLDPLARKNDQVGLSVEDVTAQEYERQQQAFIEFPKLKWVAKNLDFPLIPILYKMEKRGVTIDPAKFAAMAVGFDQEIKSIEQEIYNLAGHPFNINSPMQLSEILYEELGLPTKGVKKMRRFHSTGQKELDKLRALHPIIPEIERIREISKLLSTYVAPLPQLADSNQRIHTTYTQDVTATGRLSSVNPNLQNIPVRTDEGKRIRDGFIASKGKIFVSADYAQFELRLAAALAGDDKLIADFNAGLDIHTKTASDSFHVPIDQVTPDQRRAAKVINFGVLYGMSAKGLSEATGMSVSESKDFIEKYFELRLPIRRYLDATLAQARDEGYVETVFGRRRPTPDVKSPNYVVRAAAERAAANMPIQGTEADLMKLAMIKLDQVLPADADLLLQVHDSLIVECDESQKEEVAKILRETMEQIAPVLPVKLAVDVQIGHDWGEL
ncbi:MAG: DNA polymerase I [Candidatus Nomurabacteria bacterium]|jgi:DNA polymerase-1|nr:DNA polymerase I [Candidatus Nomurabacteria bacterium]